MPNNNVNMKNNSNKLVYKMYVIDKHYWIKMNMLLLQGKNEDHDQNGWIMYPHLI